MNKKKHFYFDILKMLHCNLIVPHLFYEILLWVYSTSRLLNLQKKLIVQLHKKILKINDIHQLQQLKCIYKIQNHTLPLYFNSCLPRHKTNQKLTCCTRHAFAQKWLRFDIPHLLKAHTRANGMFFGLALFECVNE